MGPADVRFQAASEVENFTVDFGGDHDEDVPAPEETAAKDVLLDHRKWTLLDRMEQMELLCLLQARYVAPGKVTRGMQA